MTYKKWLPAVFAIIFILIAATGCADNKEMAPGNEIKDRVEEKVV